MTSAFKITFRLWLCCLVIVMLLVSCRENGNQHGTSKPALSDFEFLELGMEYNEVVTRMGEADRDIGSGVHLMVYELEDGRELVLSFPSFTSLAAAYVFDPGSGEQEIILESDA